VTLRRALVAAILALAGMVALPTAASAHAELVSSDPAGGATLDTAPTQITLTFTEAPDPSLSGVELLNAGGATVPTGPPTLAGPRTLVVPITEKLREGVYTVSVRVVSADDGHVTSEAFPFGVGTSPGSSPPRTTTSSGPTPLSVVAKSLLYAGLMLLVAIAVVGEGLFRGAPTTRRVLGVAAGGAAVLGTLAFLLSEQRSIGVPMGRYLDSVAARDPIWIVVASVLALVCAVAGARYERPALPWAAAVLAAIALAVRARGGHAAGTDTPVLDETLQWVHMVAAACWAGGLVLLILLLRERRGDAPVGEARRYSTLAVAAIAIVVASGLVRAVTELGGLHAVTSLFDTTYGRTLAAKVAVVLVVVGLGAWNRYRSVAGLRESSRPLRRIATAEIVGIAGVLALTATLTSLAPPAAPTAPEPPDAITLMGSDFATTMSATVHVTPGRPGHNAYDATITAYGTATPVAADRVTVELRSITSPQLPTSTVALHADGGAWAGEALDPSLAGTYALTLAVQSGAQVTELPLVLTTRSAGTTTTTSALGGGTIASATFRDGVRVDASTDTGSPTQIHLTAFAPDGTELPVKSASLVAIPASGAPQHLAAERFSAGHFAASPTLVAGTWTFDAVMIGRDGNAYQLTWSASVG
jgi:copper transport protein